MKKLFLVFLSIFVINITLFAKSGGSVDLTANLGGSFPMFEQSGDYKLDIKPDLAFEWGLYLKPTGYLDLGLLSLGLSLDLGYQRDVFAYEVETGKGNLTLDSLVVGLTPKLNVGIITFGVGGGIKFPLGGSSSFTEKVGTTTGETYYYKDLKDKYNNVYIPFIMTSVDITLFNTLILGVYASYDIPLIETKGLDPNVKFSSIDLGGTIGISF